MNVLIQGTSPFIADVLGILRRAPHRREFIWPDRPIPGNTPSATVLVQEIGALSPHALDALNHLIADTHPEVHVIATSSVVLYELVERGQFPTDLYYRLNIVMLSDDRGSLSGQASWSELAANAAGSVARDYRAQYGVAIDDLNASGVLSSHR